MIRRGFVDIDQGQIHYRYTGLEHTDKRPLIMFHGEPASSYVLEPMIAALGKSRPVYAPDTLGTGDSSVLPFETLEVPELAEISFSAITALGDVRDFDNFDLYGTYTGGHIAAQVALAHGDVINALVLDEAGLIPEDMIPDLVANYVPDLSIDTHGHQFYRLFQWVRDQYIYFPWYARDKEHWRDMDLPPPDVLFRKTMEVLKGKDSMPVIFAAVFRHDLRMALSQIELPTLATAEEVEIVPGAAPLDMPFHEAVSAPVSYVEEKAKRITAFLESHA
ncbi:MAG: alpha/beta hydrolase [Rhodospirillaceae bacterium]|jgi:pimeloyl-ACP methyl ester carboxylesterase|nr:alpha/beta hydrolase [Rhodospirillaceae bacterium]